MIWSLYPAISGQAIPSAFGLFWVAKTGNFTDNFNLAYLYNNKTEADNISKEVGGDVIVHKNWKWVVVKDGMYLSNNEKFVSAMKEAYLFSRSTAEQYAKELKGEAVQVLSK